MAEEIYLRVGGKEVVATLNNLLATAGLTGEVLSPESIALKLTPEEKKLRRREYRKLYRKRPDVQAKLKAKSNDPIVKEKRRQYAAQPHVKERKRYLAKRRRLVGALLREKQPHVHQELVNVATEVIDQCVTRTQPIEEQGTEEPMDTDVGPQEIEEGTF